MNLMGFCGETGFADYPIFVSLDRPVFSPFRGWSQRLPRNKHGISLLLKNVSWRGFAFTTKILPV